MKRRKSLLVLYAGIYTVYYDIKPYGETTFKLKSIANEEKSNTVVSKSGSIIALIDL